MDIGTWKQKITKGFQKYRYAAIVILAGIVLMLIPGKKDEQKITKIDTENTVTQETTEQRLENILSCVSGAGKVQVMLTYAQGELTLYQTDTRTSTSDNLNDVSEDTIILSDAQRQQTGLIKQVLPPTYLGAIILCEGAESPAVCLSMVDAVSKVTGLGADRISVLKMK